MRVVIAGDYPENPPSLVGGIQAVIYNTLECLGDYADLDLHVVTCEKWRTRPLKQTVRTDRWTVHYLPSSPRIPHTVSVLAGDRWAIRRRIASLSPDLIHAHGQVAAYPFAAFDTRVPTVITVHGINELEARVEHRGGEFKTWLRIALWSAIERRCLRRATDVIVISPFVEQVISPHTQAQLHTIENPVHDAFFQLQPQPVPGRVLMAGTICKRKGYLEAIRAMSLVRRQMPDAELYIAGGFTTPFQEYGDQVKQAVADIGAEPYVHFLGYLEHEALLEAYRTAQVFLFPSWLESSPVALAEAMASGLPSVVSDIGGTEHLVEDGMAGYRVAVGDVQALADSILRLLSAQDTCQRFGQRARELAQARFTSTLAARKLHDLYRSLVDSGRRQD